MLANSYKCKIVLKDLEQIPANSSWYLMIKLLVEQTGLFLIGQYSADRLAEVIGQIRYGADPKLEFVSSLTGASVASDYELIKEHSMTYDAIKNGETLFHLTVMLQDCEKDSDEDCGCGEDNEYSHLVRFIYASGSPSSDTSESTESSKEDNTI